MKLGPCSSGTSICVEDNNDPCEGVTCDPGFSCVNGNCVQDAVETVVVSGAITSNTTWSSDKIYELANKVVVDNGATLTIEAGTIVKGREGTGRGNRFCPPVTDQSYSFPSDT